LFSFREHKKLIVYSVLILNKLILLKAPQLRLLGEVSLGIYHNLGDSSLVSESRIFHFLEDL
jgi:hypothetical protein